jgi:hypothetical protein
MKTKEEIEQLAELYTQDGIYLSESEKQQTEIAYMTGYIQCQEDMADAIKKQISDFQHDLRECTSTYIKENCEGAIFGLNRLLQSLKKQG